jgi:hypothetical protein
MWTHDRRTASVTGQKSPEIWFLVHSRTKKPSLFLQCSPHIGGNFIKDRLKVAVGGTIRVMPVVLMVETTIGREWTKT